MKATIEINRLRIHARHGVMDQEYTVGNTFEISLSLETEIKPDAYADDNLTGTINYASITDIVKQEMKIPSALIENVAYRIKTAILNAYPDIQHGSVKVAKLLPPISNVELESVAVKIGW